MDSGVGGASTIVCDELGNFVAAFCTNFSNVSSPLHAEALTARASMVRATTRGFDNLLIEGDSLQIVEALRSSFFLQSLKIFVPMFVAKPTALHTEWLVIIYPSKVIMNG